ncbi:MAG: MFS transporter [Actinomycetota bacterium]
MTSSVADPVDVPAFVHPLRRPEFRNLLGITIVVALGFGMVIPAVPLFARSFGVTVTAVGLVTFVFGLTRFSFGLVGGLVVDRFGDRASTIAGLLIVAVSSYAAALAPTFELLVIARGFGGAGSALFIQGLMNRVLRIIEPAAMGRAIGSYRTSFLIGTGLGPLFGGLVIEAFGLRAPFTIYATGLLVAAAIAWFAMQGESGRTPVRRSPGDALRAARPLLRDTRYVIALLGTFVAWWTISGPGQNLAVLFADGPLGLGKGTASFGLSMLAVGEILILFPAGKAADRRGRRFVLIPSLAVSAGAIVAVGQIEDAPWAYLPLMAILGAATAAASIATGGLLADAVPRSGSGAAVGLNQMVGDMGYLIAPLFLLGLADGLSFRVAYVVGALPAAAVLVLAFRLPRRPPPGSDAEEEDARALAPSEAEPHGPVG